MSCGWNPCSANCPPVTVTIQPPPFVLSIPGPSIYCPDQPVCIEQSNPCVPRIEGGSRAGYQSACAGRSSSSNAASIYSQKTQQSSTCRRF
ncbi:hypothetical protein lerEdw1_013119 [Lerista edwardsae]|nr:hypothetical protein lerEdw1_013119 [Lerista edwardsae]